MGIIDIHTHIGKWSESVNFVESDLLNVMQQNRVDYFIVSNLSGIGFDPSNENRQPYLDEVEANKEVYLAFKDNPSAFLYAICNPLHGSAENIRTFLKQHRKKFVGLKFHPQMTQLPANSNLYDDYMVMAKEFDIPCLFHCDSLMFPYSNPNVIYELAKRHPDVKVILGHLSTGGVDSKIRAIEVMLESIATGNSQIYCDVSFCQKEVIVQLIKCLPNNLDRILFGSDCPIANMREPESYARFVFDFIIEPVRKEFGNVADDILFHLLIGNAEKLFRIGP